MKEKKEGAVAIDAREKVNKAIIKSKRAPCKDCGKDTEPMGAGRPLFSKWDLYLVRDEVWERAGMKGWASGYLCIPCLSKRLGRRIVSHRDCLLYVVGATEEGLHFMFHPDYLKHPSVDPRVEGRLTQIEKEERIFFLTKVDVTGVSIVSGKE